MIESQRLKIFYIIAAFIVFAVFFVGRKNISEGYMTRCNSSGIIEDRRVVLSDCLFAAVMGDDDMTSDAGLEKAKILYDSGDLDSAEREFLKILENDSENLEANIYLAEIYHDRGDFFEAEEYYGKSYDMYMYGNALIDRVKNLARCGRGAEAKALLESRGNEDEDVLFYSALLDLAENDNSNDIFYSENGKKHEEAILLIREFLDSETMVSKNEKYVAVKKADLFMQIRENDFAFLELGKIEEDKKYRDLMVAYGKAYFLDGDYEKSEQYFFEALNIDGDSSEALIYLSEIFSISGRSEEARVFFSRYEAVEDI